MKQYLDLVKTILQTNSSKEDRTGTGTISIFGHQMRFPLSEGFPLVTTKKTNFRLIASELLWFLKGETNIKYLLDNNNHIWDEWANENGDLGPVYGAQWRDFNGQGCDQIANAIHEIKTNPNSRRILVSAWNPLVLPDPKKSFAENIEEGKAALPACHTFFQFYVQNNKLSCQMYQRSGDTFLGVPFNIASYALLTHMVAHVCGLEVGDFVHTLGDAHIYKNHIPQVELQLTRDPKPLPKLWLNPEVTDIFSFTLDDIRVDNYDAHPHIKGEVSV